MKTSRILLCGLLAASTARAQVAAHDTTAKSVAKAAATEPIMDNAFLVEEAFNQEKGVVQHISTFSRTNGIAGWAYSLTQEWPIGGQRHQISYTIPVAQQGAPTSTGVGDIMVNYRLQAIADESRGLYVAPRISWSFPTGDEAKGFGLGGGGLQLNLPVSKEIGASFISHTNVGGTWFAKAPGAGDPSASQHNVFLGQSLYWLARSRFNVMLEAMWTRTTTETKTGSSSAESVFLVPGIRWGYDFKSGLQVVPGIGVPIGMSGSNGTHQVFLYLSFEHPFANTGN